MIAYIFSPERIMQLSVFTYRQYSEVPGDQQFHYVKLQALVNRRTLKAQDETRR